MYRFFYNGKSFRSSEYKIGAITPARRSASESQFYKSSCMPHSGVFEMLKKVGAPAVKVLTPEHLHKTWRRRSTKPGPEALREGRPLLSGLVKVLVAIDQEGQSNRRVRPWDLGSVATDVQTRTNIDLAHETTYRGGQLSHDKLTPSTARCRPLSTTSERVPRGAGRARRPLGGL